MIKANGCGYEGLVDQYLSRFWGFQGSMIVLALYWQTTRPLTWHLSN